MTKIYEEACQLYIEQEIEEGIKQGKSAYSIGKEIAGWVEKIFGRKVSPDAIKQKTLRKRKDSEHCSDSNLTTENIIEKEKKRSRSDDGRFSEGNEGGPGRPPKYVDKPWYSCAEQMVGIAISQLSRIPIDDPKRAWAKQAMLEWVNNNL